MASLTPTPRLRPVMAAVHTAFGMSMLALGLLHLTVGEALTRAFPLWPDWLPGRPFWAHAAGAILLGCGACILTRRAATAAALTAGGVFLLAVVVLHLPNAIPSGHFGGEWGNVCKWLSMACGCILVSTTIRRADGETFPAARTCAAATLSAFLIGAAILHLRYAPFVAELMPAWFPARVFWAYATAGTLTAGGIGILVPRTARLAAYLTSLMIFLWIPLVHLPRTLADLRSPVGWSEVAEALAFSLIAFLLATTTRPTRDGRQAPRVPPDIG